ncbi:MAG: polysaccharide biosynthesis/export family protein [Candidatus Binatus sp.]|uniref:polysaccharide biosynthesis/export family protein n=1 Tax=Candidatus Binatus sp. TaxID=2811406 RepID=UPI00271F7D72|nr:polysaccharide biosynthesis/export family protein [Candidatus Binatus sp.]MDO8432696.1 polysaccharide biosynthesis/export family protein [Candidatus Binatus sp.]
MSQKASAAIRNALLATFVLLAAGCAATDMKGDVSIAASEPAETGCVMSANYKSPSDERQNYRIQAGDDLAITFYRNPEFDTEVIVRPDGKISMRVVGDPEARGLSPTELSARLNKAYSSELLEPGVSVVVKNSPSRVVFVQGQVDHPAAVPLQPDMTALGAIAQAGGFSDGANPNDVVLIRRDFCGQPHGVRLQIGKVLSQKKDHDNEEDAQLLPGDLLVVPRSKIASIDLFMKQYVKDLLPVQPFMPIL